MFNRFIDRPVLSSVIAIITVVLGLIGIYTIPAAQYPDIAPPTVQVSTSYPGANAETMLKSVVSPIEEQVNGVEGMTYITSTASNTGSASIMVFFKQGTDPDIAAVNVQNRVARANSVLPTEVIRQGIITEKQENSALMYASVFTTNKEYDAVYLDNYINQNVLPELKRIEGVSNVSLFGRKEYSIRVWLDPAKLAVYEIEPSEIAQAIQEQSQEASPGAFGQNSGQAFEYVLKYKGRYNQVSEYENVVLRASEDGSFLYLKDVAEVKVGALSYSSVSRSDGNPAIIFGMFQTPGSNAQDINNAIVAKLEELKKDFPKGIDYVINYNTNTFLNASIHKVVKTLTEAFVLVFIVVFIFLQDFRSTLIPAISVPVSIIGTFFFLELLGFSMNLLTLFAMILAIGIVVDDAIVVVEAVHAKLEKGAKDANKASKEAMSEISGAIISITLVMGAVFVPVTFIKGPAGVFYKQFGMTLIVAIFISAVNALTLSPALCAIFLRSAAKEGISKKNRFFTAFNVAFEKVKSRYTGAVNKIIKLKWVTAVILVFCIAMLVWVNGRTPTGFVPSEDRGVIFINMELPLAASLDRTFAATEELREIIKGAYGVKNITFSSGVNFFSGAGSSYALGFITLTDWKSRLSKKGDINNIIKDLYIRASQVSDANIIFFTPPSVPGYGSADGFEMQLLDKTAGDLNAFDLVAKDFVGKLSSSPAISFASNSFNTGFPQYEVEIDVVGAKRAGISVNSIFGALQGFYGGFYVSDFNKFGKPYKVFMQSDPRYRKNEASLDQVFLTNAQGDMAPIDAFVSLKRVYGPQTLNRFNLFNSVTINGSSSPGYSSGDAIKVIRELAQGLPDNYDIAFSGITREEVANAGQAPIILALSVLFVFFFLSAQYESYFLPFAVLLSLPIGVSGAFLFTYLTGLENNIYFQIALVMLIGLLAKNAILIVEFARQRREEGLPIIEAAVEGAQERLRPILMTAFAFILGLLPLVFADGVGAHGNRSIGTGAAGGLFVGTVVGVFFIPALYVLCQWTQERLLKKKPQ
ncbi:multidrug transporter AcrB (plasmid) [Fulvitalea axinellae]|uniref:Multidrug transporter AcrB n=1 Tax=Fulvitalea axinellae TaxID=1182444 RepID=A0AAU9CNH9_9BACT|nr:multidrug transporter AcrB [Fulvitalea axinellae]